jgi:hypothetical protein
MGGGDITFLSTVDGAYDFTINTAGATTFGGAVGGSAALGSVTTTAWGTTVLNGGSVTTAGAQTYNNPVTLGPMPRWRRVQSRLVRQSTEPHG